MGTKSYSTGYESATATKNIAISVLNAADLSILEDEPEQCVERTIASPMDRPERWTFGCKSITDVYKGTGVSTAAKPSSTSGVQIIVKHESMTAVTDSEDANYLKQLPQVSYFVQRVPINDLMTADMALQEAKRMLAGLFGSADDVTSSRLAQLICGALRAQ